MAQQARCRATPVERCRRDRTRLARACLSGIVSPNGAMKSATPKRIMILRQPDGDVVARHTELGKIVGQFFKSPSGEIGFSFSGDSRRLYVNKSFTAFCEAAAMFNRFCELHADDE